MLRVVIWLGLIAVLAAGQPVSAEPKKGSSYIKGEFGYVFGWEADHDLPPGAPSGEVDIHDGFTGAVSSGRYFKRNWHYNAELSYLQNHADGIDDFDDGATGDLRAYTAMLNIYRDFPLNQKWRPYVGVGIGAVLIDPDYVLPGPITDGKDLNFGAQGSAGIDYDISERTSVGVRYRYLWAGKYDFGPYRVRYDNHSVLAGLTYRWGPKEKPEPPAPPPPPPPPPPAPPAPPAEPNELLDIVLFPHDSYEITPAASEILDQVAQIIREKNITLIRLEGYTDTTGSHEYNMRLSQNRATSVRDALIERGVPPTNVYITAHGETKLRVPTADNVRNQQNRYVQVFVKYD